MKRYNISGIYQIGSYCKPNRLYIGSSVDLQRRWNVHICELRNNTHGNIKLQRHYNKYGVGDLQFSIILECKIEDLIRYEQYCLDTYCPYFNICKIAGITLGYKHSEETKIRMRKPKSKEHKEKLSVINRGKPRPNYRKAILQYDKNMNLIKEWESGKNAALILEIQASDICSCLKGKPSHKTAGGFIWKYKIL